MSVKTAQGGYAFAGGQDTTDLILTLVGGVLTLTNALQADGFINSDNGYVWKIDLRPYRQVRLTGRINVVSTSANNPRLQLRYSPTYTLTVANYAQLGSSSVEFSMFTGASYGDSGWIDLKDAARIDNCYLGLFNIGGDGAADPIVNQVVAQFR